MKAKKHHIWIVLVMFVALFIGVRWRETRNPFDKVDFIVEYPGANGRLAAFTPVLKANPSVAVGPVTGADYGKLWFKDLDGDGVKEAIVETKLPWSSATCFPSRHVLRYTEVSPTGRPHFEPIESVYMDPYPEEINSP